jgi:aminoglycoside phosphotransferase (APT) family kinase protein
VTDIPGYGTFTKIEPLNQGWSSDTKYYIETADGERLLLRIADITEYDRKLAEYAMLKRVAELDIIVSRPVDFGVCDNGQCVFQLLTWIEGQDAESVLPTLTETQQYVLGLKAGQTLRKMHTIPAPVNAEDWDVRFSRKVQGRIDFYRSHPIQSGNGDIIVHYLQCNQHMLSGRPQTFNHGDYNTTNLIVTPDGNIGVIDFNYYNSDYGDPWWEFDPASWGAEPRAYFLTGQINGYFDGRPPLEFFEMQTYYSAYDALAALCDTSVGEQGELKDGQRHVDNTLRWFNNMQNPVPSWYLKNLYVKL